MKDRLTFVGRTQQHAVVVGKMMKKWLLLVALLSAQVVAAEVNWQGYEEARALDSDKPLFVFAKMRFCATCAAMEDKVFTDPELAQLLNEKFIPVRETVNFGFSKFVFEDLKDEQGKTLKFGGFPTVMLVQGEHYSLSQGYKSAEELKAILSKASSTNVSLGR